MMWRELLVIFALRFLAYWWVSEINILFRDRDWFVKISGDSRTTSDGVLSHDF